MTVYPAKKTKQGLYSVTVSQGDVSITCVDESREIAFKMARKGVMNYLLGEKQ